MKNLIIYLLVLLTISVYANEEHDHDEKGHDEKSKEHGDDRETQKLPGGVTFFEDESGEFSLKEKVLKNFGIVLGVESNAGEIEIPEAAIVRSLKETSVFVQNGNRFKAVPVKISSSSGARVRVTGVPSGVKVVLKGNNFLKTILLSLEEGPSEGHGH